MRIAVIFGTRPEAIKLAPVINELKKHHDVLVVSSGQHKELVRPVINFFGIFPNVELSGINKNRTLSELASFLIKELDTVFKKHLPELVVVQGDTMTAFVSSFVAFLNKIPVAHVEAGLRTYDKYSPFPEEMMRRMIGNLADIHFVPTEIDRENLLEEKVDPSRIFLVGNTVVDALKCSISTLSKEKVYSELSAFGIGENILENGKLVFITSHRRENIGKPLEEICDAVKDLAVKYPEITFIWSLHLNPDVRRTVKKVINGEIKNIHLIEPISYESTVYLIDRAFLVLTDSGGLQEECASLGKPVLILRKVTERSVVVSSGAGFLVGSDKERISYYFEKFLGDRDFYMKVSNRGKGLFGDGKSSKKIRMILETFFKYKETTDFSKKEERGLFIN
ncbi:non-hydrolyzing UDP-N-acetylglucosamine 2-epimerase [Persephonella sp.]